MLALNNRATPIAPKRSGIPPSIGRAKATTPRAMLVARNGAKAEVELPQRLLAGPGPNRGPTEIRPTTHFAFVDRRCSEFDGMLARSEQPPDESPKCDFFRRSRSGPDSGPARPAGVGATLPRPGAVPGRYRPGRRSLRPARCWVDAASLRGYWCCSVVQR